MHSVLEWLEATAARIPDRTALSDPDGSLTWAELRDGARAIGTVLAGLRCAAPQRAVALYLEKSPCAFAAMLGAVYAGDFYSVIDVRQPRNRVEACLAALDPAAIVTDAAHAAELAEVLPETDVPVLSLEELGDGACDEALLATRRAQVTDAAPLYVNFTSGSTGTPKGVVVATRSVLDFIPVFVDAFGIGQDDVICNQAPFDFDVSVKDLYTSLLTGATVHLVPRAYFSNPTMLMDYLDACRPTTLTWAVSALCFVSIMGGLDYLTPSSVVRVLFSGEVMPPKQLAAWQQALPKATFVNLYGPTEITCNCTYHVVERTYEPGEVIPMGRAFANEEVFLLDEQNRLIEPTTVGVEGEVCVAGTCLALGYLGDPARTAEAFVQNPLNDRWRSTIYRTGDLATYDEHGDLVYASRKDHQIKHLGQRIELGDIEAAANGVEGVEQACCLYDATRKRIVCYYTGTAERKELKGRLRELLPSYMVPNNTRHVDCMPLTKNGKIDRGALAALKAR